MWRIRGRCRIRTPAPMNGFNSDRTSAIARVPSTANGSQPPPPRCTTEPYWRTRVNSASGRRTAVSLNPVSRGVIPWRASSTGPEQALTAGAESRHELNELESQPGNGIEGDLNRSLTIVGANSHHSTPMPPLALRDTYAVIAAARCVGDGMLMRT